MIKWVLTKIVGSKNQREIKRMRPIVEKINQLEVEYQSLTDDELREKVSEWQDNLHRFLPLEMPTKRIIENSDEDELEMLAEVVNLRFEPLLKDFPSLPKDVVATPASIEEAKEAFSEIEEKFPKMREDYLTQILPEAYAAVKNAARRMCGQKIQVTESEIEWQMVHFDVQLVGGIALHRGMISEMQTGEGKTLVATLPTFLNALTGLGVHVVTVNDYLARRDSEWMGALFKFLGLTIGCIQNQQPPQFRREQYIADITYGTNSEFGFDYLRDNGMASSKEEQVQRGHYYAIIDEVDSILIDEARTPLIISGPAVVETTQQYEKFRGQVDELVKRQRLLCTDLANEAKKLIEKGDLEAAGVNLFKVKLGQPRNRLLMRAMEDPDVRRQLEKTELSFYQDTQKKELFALKEELYFTIDEKGHDADLMEKGRNLLAPNDADAFILPDLATEYAHIDADLDLDEKQRHEKKEELQKRLDSQGERMHSISQLLKAYCLYEKDVQYVVKDKKVIIVDENTGREMPGRRWSDGLHQAVEAKENVTIEKETQTYATITIQNYFRLYEKLGGMTGTAETEAAEFSDIYRLDVLPIPTNQPNKRVDHNDQVFKTRREKYNAVVNTIREANEKGQPVLVGTDSVEASETLSRMLDRAKIKHSVLNAKFHQQEAEIVANAGQRGAVTVSTNMAGRGTDIKLGEGVSELGGLFVVGTERYQSRRIDRQLRGRCARQGDPGSSQFFISFEDALMRNFAAADRMTSMMERFGMEEGEALEHKWLNRSVETAQKRVEQRNYQGRKHVLDYDNVMNQQREIVYGYRNDILNTEDTRSEILEVIEQAIPAKVTEYLTERDDGRPDYTELLGWINSTFPLQLTHEDMDWDGKSPEDVAELVIDKVKKAYELKATVEEPEQLDSLERHVILVAIDKLWQQHLYSMDALREGVGLRARGQKDPLVEYKNEAYKLFAELMDNIRDEALGNLFKSTTNLEKFETFLKNLPRQLSGDVPPLPNNGQEQNLSTEAAVAPPEEKLTLNIPEEAEPEQELPKQTVGRNEPCPCGSGKKFKQCCGRVV